MTTAVVDLDLASFSRGLSVDRFAAGDKAGTSVAGIGDLNGDGLDDLAVGAPGANDGQGQVRIVFGTAPQSAEPVAATPDLVIDGIFTGDGLGASIGAAGDFNADGIDDLLIGAPNASGDIGQAYILFGNTVQPTEPVDLGSLTGEAGLTLFAEEDSGFAGASLAGLGDFNGDGFDDVAVSAPGAPGGGETAGETYILFGGPDIQGDALEIGSATETPGLTVLGGADGDFVGQSIAAAGDLNNDGLADLLIGAHLADGPAGETAGAAFIVYGRADEVTAIDLGNLADGEATVIHGAETDELLGQSVSSAGDFNGDGFDDLILGAPGAGGNGTGAAYILLGSETGLGAEIDLATLDGSKGFAINGRAGFDITGQEVALAGDVNGDGFDDLLISAPNAIVSGQVMTGTTTLLFGSSEPFAPELSLSDLVEGQALTLAGTEAFDRSGLAASAAGDINGDELADIIIGAPGSDIAGPDSGRAFVIFGGSTPELTEIHFQAPPISEDEVLEIDTPPLPIPSEPLLIEAGAPIDDGVPLIQVLDIQAFLDLVGFLPSEMPVS